MITLERVSRDFRVGDETVRAVREVSLEVAEAELTAVVGPSGGGKTTLLNLIGQLISPTSGTIAVDGTVLTGMGPREAARHRNEMFGYLVQDFALVESDTVFDNVRIPLVYSRRRVSGQRKRVSEALDQFGIGPLIDHPVRLLSGGQRQRVALARAIVNSPEAILADEPTGALDEANGLRVFEHLRELAAEGRTVVMVTHNMTLADRCDAIHEIRDGILTTKRTSKDGELPRRATTDPREPGERVTAPRHTWRHESCQ